MSENYEVAPDGRAKIDAVDSYLEQTIRSNRPIEALIATKQLGEIVDTRAKQAAQAATEGSWSWTDVGRALGVSRQAAHEKLRARIQGKLDKRLAKLDQVEQAGHEKIARRAERQRKKLDQVPRPSPKIERARERISDGERRRHEKLSRDLQKARDEFAKAEQKVNDKLDDSAGAP
jgi:DNA repair exonuclease SbcCD ATPase subunit